MASDVQNISNLTNKDVFTSQGAYCGKVRDVELNLPKFKVRAMVVDAAQGSYLAQKVGGKKGVIVPYSMVNAVNDVIIIRHFTGEVAQAAEGELEEQEREQVEEATL